MKMVTLVIASLISFAAVADQSYNLSGIEILANEQLTDFKIGGDIIETPYQVAVETPMLTYKSSIRGPVSEVLRVSAYATPGIVSTLICESLGAKVGRYSGKATAQAPKMVFAADNDRDSNSNEVLRFKALDSANTYQVTRLTCDK